MSKLIGGAISIAIAIGIFLAIQALTGGFSFEPGNCFANDKPDYVGSCDEYTNRYIASEAGDAADCEPLRSYFEHDDKGWCIEPQVAVGVCAVAPPDWKRGDSADVW